MAAQAALAVLVVLTAVLAFTESPEPAAAPLNAGVIASVHGQYDVRPDEGIARAEWSASLYNSGAIPFLPADDPFNAPSSVDIFVPAGFSDFSATGANGAPLPVTYEDVGYASIATVDFGRVLGHGESISFNYAYTIGASTVSGILISPTYVYIWGGDGLILPIGYESAVLDITMPTSYAQKTRFDFGQCEGEPSGDRTTFRCVGNEGGIRADFEVIDEALRISVSHQIDVDGRDIELILRYWEGDEAWAARTKELVETVMPVYADMFGAPYAGPKTIRISEKGGSEIYGARGVALCQNTICALAATPAADDQVILHEISHMWSGPFDNRWLTEGIAEYTSLKAAAILGIPGFEVFADPEQASQATARAWLRPEAEVMAEAPDFKLDPWGGRFGFDPGDIFIVPQSAYSWGARFWQEIERRHGDDPFRQVMSQIQWKAQDGTIDSEAVMDLLEDAGGVAADDLFKSYIFTEDKHPVLDQRRAVRDRFTGLQARHAAEAPDLEAAVFAPIKSAIQDWRFKAADESIAELEGALDAYLSIRVDLDDLRTAATAAGLSFPAPWEETTRTWQFDTEVVAELDLAYEAIDAYLAAKADVDAPRSFFQKIGLLGRDDRAELDEAAGHFAWARFERSIEASQASQAAIAGAHSDGVLYLAVVGAVAGAMIVFIAVVYVVSRWEEEASATGTEA